MFQTFKASRDPLLFDIRLQNSEHDVLLIKGGVDQASSVLLSGTIVLSVLEPIQIKTLSLRLMGRIRLNIPSSVQSTQNIKRNMKYEKIFYNHNWDNFNIEDYFENLYTNYDRKKSISSSSSTNVSGLAKRNRSNSSLLSLGGSSSYHTLVKGNYEFPFSAILPGSLTESVEGLPNASVTYKLEASISRPKNGDLIRRKHLRVVRTLSPDSVELSETVAVDNVWPDKVEYSISAPAKAIPIGSSTPIHIMIVPLIKGLRLGPIKISVVETSQYCGNIGGTNSQDRIVTKMKIKDPLKHVAKLKKSKNHRERDDFYSDDEEDFEFQDKWEVNTILNIPPSLSKCTQDCNILRNIKVRHKLKFVISLINSDGHISELRASLPVQFFISPFVAVFATSSEIVERVSNSFGMPSINITNDDTSISHKNLLPIYNTEEKGSSIQDNEEILFARSTSEINLNSRPLENNINATAIISDLMAPPNYEHHVYDKLWNNIPIIDTPQELVHSTQFEHSNRNDGSMDDDQFIHHLRQNLRQLDLDTEGTVSTSSSRRPSYTLSESNSHPNLGIDFTASPVATPGYDHISRRSSFLSQRQFSSSSLKKEWELSSLSRVPSYEKAMRADVIDDDLPPTYPVAEEQENAIGAGQNIERPQTVRHRSSSLLTIPASARSKSQTLNRSNNSSSSSLNTLFLSNTSGSLNNVNSNRTTNSFSLSMTPVGTPSISATHMQKSSSRTSSNNSQRQSSLVNLVEMLTKKKKNSLHVKL
ncbi:hypothetical protein KAFR_0C02430 [Kazachstania africana CBS 2517]|uniref:Arrestin C-terminal-like domain-containing protein n=1 Tax=Kazachstania africana (strain ATCC 22294 / BCRC 22015 / CBS 2517 / CECT 1963 / NBRC 1671 / NRRL Y-8276) TaxID=1071382 RepID=H2AS86_KAZAF|nr:hypothetical protein KAFR_0C02430 [Kazachstania africana CBS 2517]CCF57236.1 hypothetical protein KAFR_0C02430 [Kazachstania africana CBS 2517]